MQKHFLVTLSDDISASTSLHFVRNFFTGFCDVKLTLFYVVPLAHHLPHGGLADPAEATLDAIAARKRSKGRKVLEKARDWVIRIANCPATQVDVKLAHSRIGTVREIVREGIEGLYDAVILGRQGSFWFRDVFEDSVSHALLWQEIAFPLWVARPMPGPRSGVLLAVDGSDQSLRMADHVGFVLEGERRHEVTLLAVDDGKAFAGGDPQLALDEARLALLGGGMDPARIRQEIVKSANVTKAVTERANNGKYAVVAVGRRAHDDPTTRERLFPSSVSVSLLRGLEDCALWISK